MADEGNPREDAALEYTGPPRLGVVGPHFDAVGDRVQQPGTMHRDMTALPQDIHHPRPVPNVAVQDRASDKFAVVSLIVDQSRPFQILPLDPNRKTGLIVVWTAAVLIGDQSSISNALGATFTGTNVNPGCFALPPSSLSGSYIAFKYTCKQALYACAAAPGTAQLQCMVERYESGTPIA